MGLSVPAGDDACKISAFPRHSQALADGFHQRHTARLMAGVVGPYLCRGEALAQVVDQGSPTHLQWGIQLGGAVDDPQDVFARIDLRMVFRVLGHAKQPVHLRQDAGQGPALPQHGDHSCRVSFHQAPGDFLPGAFRYQGIHFPIPDHLGHEGQGLVGHGECWKAGGEARHPQDAHRVLGKGFADMAQHLVGQVLPATIEVDDVAFGIFRQGVDGEIPAT